MLRILIGILIFVFITAVVYIGPKAGVAITVSMLLVIFGTACMVLASGNPGMKDRYKIFFSSITAIVLGFFIFLSIK